MGLRADHHVSLEQYQALISIVLRGNPLARAAGGLCYNGTVLLQVSGAALAAGAGPRQLHLVALRKRAHQKLPVSLVCIGPGGGVDTASHQGCINHYRYRQPASPAAVDAHLRARFGSKQAPAKAGRDAGSKLEAMNRHAEHVGVVEKETRSAGAFLGRKRRNKALLEQLEKQEGFGIAENGPLAASQAAQPEQSIDVASAAARKRADSAAAAHSRSSHAVAPPAGAAWSAPDLAAQPPHACPAHKPAEDANPEQATPNVACRWQQKPSATACQPQQQPDQGSAELAADVEALTLLSVERAGPMTVIDSDAVLPGPSGRPERVFTGFQVPNGVTSPIGGLAQGNGMPFSFKMNVRPSVVIDRSYSLDGLMILPKHDTV